MKASASAPTGKKNIRKKVISRTQAVAIALSEVRESGTKIPEAAGSRQRAEGAKAESMD